MVLCNGFRGYFVCGGGWIGFNVVNILVDIIYVFIVVSCLFFDFFVFKDVLFFLWVDISNVMYWYFYKVCKEVGKVFGGDCEYIKVIGGLFVKMVVGLFVGVSRLLEEDFMEEFEGLLRRVVEWVGVWVYEGV